MGEDVQMNMQKIDLVDELMRKVIFRDDEEAFCQLFYDLFPPLCAFAHRYVEEKETCEDIVQEVFFRIWKNRRHIDIQVSARNFLITSVRNICLDSLRKKETERHWAEQQMGNESDEYVSELYTTTELENLLNEALGKLPEVVASTFRSNRFEGKTYTEIALEKQISVKTVEAYMTKALKFLRVELKDYLPMLIVFKN